MDLDEAIKKLKELSERVESYGRNRRASTPSKGSADDSADSGTGGSGTQDANQRAVIANNAIQNTSQGTSITLTNSSGIIHWTVSPADLYSWSCTTPSGKWCPPWMGGELSVPNAAKYWTPRKVPNKSSDIVAGEITAWRAWYWTGKRLRSIFVDYEWPPNDPATGETWNGYGIHAFKSLKRVKQEYGECIGSLVVGTVALWGDVVEFEQGYTAEFARPLALDGGYAVSKIRELYSLK